MIIQRQITILRNKNDTKNEEKTQEEDDSDYIQTDNIPTGDTRMMMDIK